MFIDQGFLLTTFSVRRSGIISSGIFQETFRFSERSGRGSTFLSYKHLTPNGVKTL